MKTIKYSILMCLILLLGAGCENEMNDPDFINEIAAPSNVSALVTITQDNTGLVTITPLGEGATSYTVDFGDGSAMSDKFSPGNAIDHTYTEGSYDIIITAYGVNGLTTEAMQTIDVSFRAPENLEVVIENDAGVSRQVNVTAIADFAMTFEVYPGVNPDETPIETNIGETASYIYEEAGTYTIRVVAKGGAIETTEYTEEFEVTEILQPLESAPAPPFRNDVDYISIYGDTYTNVAGVNAFPDWGQGGQGSSWAEFDLNGDKMLQYINISYQGIEFGEEVDLTAMESLHLDIWTTDVTTLEVSLIKPGPDERPFNVQLTADQWNSVDIPLSEYTDQGLTLEDIFQMKFVGTPWAEGSVFIDNIYFHRPPSSAGPSGVEGTWKIAPEAGSLKVGPAPGSGEWWSIDATGVAQRACYYDDTYVFGNDGSFMNLLGSDTWIEGWQGGGDACGVPVAPYDGTAMATFVHDDASGTLTLNGTGAYLGLPKANNAGELPDVPVPSSITYNVELTDNDNTMTVSIEAGSGVFWTYKFIRDGAPSPIEGTWVVAPEAGSLQVGPAPGSGEWWSIDDVGVAQRACYYDDKYVFNADGSFMNVLGADTWIEGWQGGGDACGVPVAPYDGTAMATYSYGGGTLTLNGTGAYLGLPKANNSGELPDVPVPDMITYNIELSNSNTTMTVTIEAGSGVFWTYKLVKEGVTPPSPVEGTWRIAPEASSLQVGPAPGSGEWWFIDDAGVAQRACYYDDTYVFNSDGSFANVLGTDTWIEGWQGGADACGAPVAPHDGSVASTYTLSGSTLTINGAGAYLGLPKAVNAGELPDVALPDSITYDVTFENDNTMIVSIEAGSGVFWTYKLIK
ncbi:hypothetical protein [Urechidicola sp. KH5]